MKNKDGQISFSRKSAGDLDLIVPLWRKLVLHHKERSIHFKEHFDNYTWEGRKNDLLQKARDGDIHVQLAADNASGSLIGYCVSTVYRRNEIGEIESIFIEKEYRKHNIGDTFMKNALKWMDAHGVKRKIIAVAAGNEEVFGFYQKYGFYHRSNILNQVESEQ